MTIRKTTTFYLPLLLVERHNYSSKLSVHNSLSSGFCQQQKASSFSTTIIKSTPMNLTTHQPSPGRLQETTITLFTVYQFLFISPFPNFFTHDVTAVTRLFLVHRTLWHHCSSPFENGKSYKSLFGSATVMTASKSHSKDTTLLLLSRPSRCHSFSKLQKRPSSLSFLKQSSFILLASFHRSFLFSVV
jgi:hypothetical protein